MWLQGCSGLLPGCCYAVTNVLSVFRHIAIAYFFVVIRVLLCDCYYVV